MIEVGERTGRLEKVFLRLNEHYDHLLRLQRGFLIAIAWPLFELSIALIVIGILIGVLGAIGAEWNGKPLSVFGLHGFRGLLIYVSILALTGAALGLLITAVRRGWFDLGPLYYLLAYVPGIGIALRTMALSRLTWSLAIATDSDLDAQRAVELAVRSTQNSYYTSRLDMMRREIRRGQPLVQAFQAAGVYPVEFLNALETGEMSGRISETMEVLAKQYHDRARMYYRGLAVAAGAAVLLLVFGIMIFFIFQLMQLYLRPIQDQLNSM
jgi:type IV pilus assembly protein PilC